MKGVCRSLSKLLCLLRFG